MKKLIFLFSLVPCLVFGQISDDFESGSLTNWESYLPERWAADTTRAINGEFSLHHVFDNEYSGTDYIGREINNLHPGEGTTSWSFKIRYGYNPSSGNNWSVWLISDSPPSSLVDNPNGQSGFALGVNLSGNDDTLRLWNVQNGIRKAVINSGINWQNDIGTGKAALISIERDINGVWSLSVDTTGGVVTVIGEGGEDLSSSGWFVIEYNYTKTGDRLLWVDDVTVNGTFYADTTPPGIDTVTLNGRSSLEVRFSEPVVADHLYSSDFTINENENRVGSMVLLNPQSVMLNFEKEFLNKSTNILSINSLTDMAGNTATALRYGFTPVWAETADVIITEIMADPSPPVSLPEIEYIEIYNASEHDFNLKGWRLYINKSFVVLPDSKLRSGQFAILCHINDTALLSPYGDVVGLSGFPAIPNTEGAVIITSEQGNLIHGTGYSTDQYGSNLKISGGWSLEMIDTGYPFHTENWKASDSNTGGTPGSENSVSSVNPDIFFKGLINVFPTDTRIIRIDFSEPVIDLKTTEYMGCNDLAIVSLTPADSLRDSYFAETSDDMEPGKVYTLWLDDKVTDFAGNPAERDEFLFGLPLPAGSHDIVFNELLFNPYSDEPDFLEFFNLSDHPLDVSSLKLASIDTDDGDTSTVSALYPSQMCLLPGSYFVVTTDPATVINRYPESEPQRIFKIPSLPSMPDKEGHLLLLNNNLKPLDEVIYTDKMHFSLLAETEGISLEKIRPELPSDESSSWHSAAESAGFATPGKINSAYFDGTENQVETVGFSSARITPDNDGFEDVLEISFSFKTLGNVVSVSIYSETGRLIKILANNVTMENGAKLFWDGTITNGHIVASGIYIIHIVILSDNGHRADIKRVCTVIRNR